MADIIQLLSDHIANQIAAGEVIQRPASAVKEMLENAIDAGATDIHLILKDAGKELIQVIDNGKGMSVTDARMCFERHATSKIKTIEDLFRIRTMGFRGEALASIAAVAQVEMKTQQLDAEMGTRIIVEGTEVKLQEPCAAVAGTNLAVKNLFYNIPARRNFLKKNTTELKHIIDEFTRIALAYPQVGFKMMHNDKEQFHLEAGSLKKRIVDLLGTHYEKNLVPVTEETEYIHIKGFIGKPEAATRTRGMQFFFINDRFIKSPYLHHAVITGYEGLLEKETFPFYVLFLETDPARVDVNVHPTKQEVKFDDDRMMYAYLSAAIKHALARYNIAPSLDFTLSTEITQLPSVGLPVTTQEKQRTEKGYLYNSFTQKNQAHFIEHRNSRQQWKQFYEIAQQNAPQEKTPSGEEDLYTPQQAERPSVHQKILLHEPYLISTLKSGVLFIHIYRAKERILYERLKKYREEGNAVSQQLVFPTQVEIAPQDVVLLEGMLPELRSIGFAIEPFGKHSYIIQGIPSTLSAGAEQQFLEDMLEWAKHESSSTMQEALSEKIIRQAAKKSIHIQEPLSQPEHQQILIDELFACTQPEYTPGGKKVFSILKKESLEDLLG